MFSVLSWLAAALILGIVEVLSLDLFFLMLALASLGAAGTAALGFGLYAQVAVFCVLAIALLFLVRPAVKARLLSSHPKTPTNVDALIGMSARVTELVNDIDGRIRLDGEIWSARTDDSTSFTVGETVRVVRIDGATAIVAAPTN